MNATNFPYDLTNITSGGNILQFVQNVNNLTGQSFMLGMLLVGFVVLFISMRSAGNQDAMMASSFITAVLAIFFYTLQFISAGMLIIIEIVFGIYFVYTILRKE